MADCYVPESVPKIVTGNSHFTNTLNNTNASATEITAEDLSNAMKKEVWPVTILIGVEAVLGIVGNTLIILVYTLRYRRCNFKYFVLCMALIDITSCFTTLPGEMVSQLHWYNYQYEWICKIKSYFNVFTVWSSAVTLLLLAYDRYRKICRPLDWQIQPKWALRSCVISVGISGLVAAPMVILWGKQSYVYHGSDQNVTVTICEKSRFYADGVYPFLFIVGAYMAPIVIMIGITYVLNFKISKAIFINIPTAENCNGLPIIQKPVEMPTVNESQPNLQMDNQCNGGDNFQNTHRRYSDSGKLVTNGILNHRLSTSMNLKQTTGEANIFVETRLREFNPDSSSELNNCPGISKPSSDNHSKLNNSNEVVESHSENYLSIKYRSKLEVTDPAEHCQVTRVRSYSSSESSESVVLKRPKRHFLSPFFNWKKSLSLSRRRVSEIERDGEIESMIGHRHSSIRRVTKPVLLKRKTEIMLILTTVFTVTIIIYLVLSSFVAPQEGILKQLTRSQKVIFFLFWRLYFFNCIINPVLYGLMDPRFRKGLKEVCHIKSLNRKRSSKSAASCVTIV